MGRWEPNAAGRLREAAMELYLQRGYEQTTVAEIAERAGVTSRTFFRYFGDKRDVLFTPAEQFERPLVEAVEAAPADTAPLGAVAAAVDAAAELIGASRERSRARQSIIDSSAELRERELIKLASAAGAVAAALRRRGVPDGQAELAAETGMAVLRIGYQRWREDVTGRPLSDLMRESFDDLAALTATGRGSSRKGCVE
jgi:AcrR family transcriptional regulator